jgi:hypothetical protein
MNCLQEGRQTTVSVELTGCVAVQTQTCSGASADVGICRIGAHNSTLEGPSGLSCRMGDLLEQRKK